MFSLMLSTVRKMMTSFVHNDGIQLLVLISPELKIILLPLLTGLTLLLHSHSELPLCCRQVNIWL